MSPVVTKKSNNVAVEPQQLFNQNGWKKCKKDFIKFVNHHNDQKLSQTFNSDEKEALAKLHAMWRRASTPDDSHIEYYYEMNQFHEILDDKLLDNDCQWNMYKATMDCWKMECLEATMILEKFNESSQSQPQPSESIVENAAQELEKLE